MGMIRGQEILHDLVWLDAKALTTVSGNDNPTSSGTYVGQSGNDTVLGYLVCGYSAWCLAFSEFGLFDIVESAN
jgi:hypothetical protein